jgi:Uma2 family endonuclease
MNLLVPQPTYTADDLLTLPEGDRFELVDGRLTEKPVGAESSYIGGRLGRLLGDHCESPFSGWVLPADASYQFLPDRPNLVRKPDVSFIRLGRLPNEELPAGHIRLAPDLAVEVVSPNDLYYEVEAKVREHRQAGVRLVWIVVPPSRSVLVRRLDGTITEVHEGDELSGDDVVPGFRCRVADIFHVPARAQQPGEARPHP